MSKLIHNVRSYTFFIFAVLHQRLYNTMQVCAIATKL